ncbi:phage major capsid protein [Endozoicomonas sp. ALC020]|uniref:phage major capsid protein n=1 Tax=unclassified Endozoicomonas TaxID=2644528 RepID=UPI003BAF14B2
MKMHIKHFDAINRHCPDAIRILRRFYNDDEKQMQIRSNELDAEDLKDASEALAKSMETLINQAEQQARGLDESEQQAFDALQEWCQRFIEKYHIDKPLNPLPKGTREIIKDDLGNPLYLDVRRQASELSEFEPLTQDQRMSDWCRKFVRSEDLGDLKLGGYVRAWLTGEHNQQTRRTMTSTGTGGVLIPTPLAAEVIDLARNKSRVLTAGAVVWPMDSATLTVPRQTGDASVAWRPELGHIHRTGISLEPVVLKSCSLGALVTLSRELLEDAIGLNSFLTRTLSNVMAEGIDQAALSGAGAVDSETSERIEPVGVLNTADVQAIDLSAALDSYAPFSQAVTRVRQVNGEPSGLMMAPVNFGLLDALTATDGQPLMPPASWSQVRHYDTNQLDEHTAIVGDWSQLAIGVRHNLRLEYATTGQIPKEGIQEELSLFSQNAIAIRVLWRGDVAVQRPDQFVKIINMNPAPESASTESASRKKDKVA